MNEEEARQFRNSLFAQGNEASPIEARTASATAKKELGFDLPVASVPLPSKGLVYSGPLQNADAIDIRAMTAREEDILMNRAFARRGTIITELIRSCIVDKAVDVNSLISGDRHALMVAVRVTGYGSQYSAKITCPSCESQQDFEIDLQSLDIKELDLERLHQVAPYQNAFEFELPVTKKKVVFKFLTGKEEEQMVQDAEARRKKGIVQENLVTTKLMACVVSVDGNTDRSFVNKVCQFMPARDSLALRKAIDESEPGIDMTSNFGCKSCGHQEVMSVPLGPTFFWPDSK